MRKLTAQLPDAGWLLVLAPLVAAFFYAPLAFGGTTPQSVEVIDALFAASFGLWIIHLAVTRRLPKIPLLCLAALVFLILFGLSHYLNPKSSFDRESWQFTLLLDRLTWLPGSVDLETSAPLVRHFGAMAMAFIVLLDACRGSRTRWFLIRSVALAGLIIAAIGIYQRASGADSMLWVGPERSGKVFFGAFRYNANAAAFLNLSWPAALAVWLRGRATDPGNAWNSMNFCALFFLSIAVFVNTSKAGQILGLIGVIFAAIWFWGLIRPQNMSRLVIGLMSVLFLSLLLVALLPAFLLIMERWSVGLGTLEGRLLIYEAAGKILPDSNWFGTGPGTFRIVFPFYTVYLGEQLKGVYTHTHQDYLQTLIEWGYLGFAGWLTLIGGGLLIGLRYIFRMRRNGRNDITTSCSVLALSVVLIHAMADFPLQIPSVQWLAAFHLAICWTANAKEKRRVAAGP